MGRRDGFTVDGLKEWQKALAKMGGEGVAEMKSRILRTAGMRTLEYLDDLTPRRGGRLKDSYSLGHKENVFRLQVGKESYVFVGTAVPYARYVNDGFTQRAGQFVPGFWKNGVFHYVPGEEAKARGIGGMVLTGKIIPGAHMFEKALDNLDDDMPKIVEYEFRRMYRKLFG
jgi:hypothetical protein